MIVGELDLNNEGHAPENLRLIGLREGALSLK
jgi:hypothetical protein